MDVNDDFVSAHLRETNADIEEIDMRGLKSAQDDSRFELTPPSIQKQLRMRKRNRFSSYLWSITTLT